MHCPRCGQQQVSEELKFCSRCGFPLGLVSELLAHGGFLPQLADLHKEKKLLTRKNGVVFSVFWFIFFVMIMTPIWGGVFDVEGLAITSALIGVFGGLMLLIASLVWLKGESKTFAAQELPAVNAANLYAANPAALPPQQTQTARSYIPPAGMWKAPNTGELVEPLSVVENTTKLLKKEE